MQEVETALGKGKALFWDLDETLGSFRQIDYEQRYAQDSRELRELTQEEPLSLRYNMKSLLVELTAAGFRHFITTSGTHDYATDALARTGITDHFEAVYGRETVTLGWGKRYREIAENHGYTLDTMRDDVLVIGDARGDHPQDSQPVFLRLGKGRKEMDALVFREIIVALLERGNGSFRRGFDFFHENITKNMYKEKIVDLGNGIKFSMDMEDVRGTSMRWGKEQKGELVPVIYGIDAPDYMNKPPILK